MGMIIRVDEKIVKGRKIETFVRAGDSIVDAIGIMNISGRSSRLIEEDELYSVVVFITKSGQLFLGDFDNLSPLSWGVFKRFLIKWGNNPKTIKKYIKETIKMLD